MSFDFENARGSGYELLATAWSRDGMRLASCGLVEH